MASGQSGVIGQPVADIAGLHRCMERAVGPAFTTGQPIARCALDMVAHDLVGKHLGRGVGKLWGYGRASDARLSWTISCGSLAEAESLLEQGLEQGYSDFNVKLGVRPDFDLKLCDDKATGA